MFDQPPGDEHLFGKLRVFVNGRQVGQRDWNKIAWRNPYHVTWDADLTDALQIGKSNQISLVVETWASWWSGASQRMFLWSPRTAGK